MIIIMKILKSRFSSIHILTFSYMDDHEGVTAQVTRAAKEASERLKQKYKDTKVFIVL